MTFGERVKKAREHSGLTQQELAEALGYKDKSAIAKIESDVNDVTRAKLIKMAEVMRVDVGVLMGWEELPEDELQ